MQAQSVKVAQLGLQHAMLCSLSITCCWQHKGKGAFHCSIQQGRATRVHIWLIALGRHAHGSTIRQATEMTKSVEPDHRNTKFPSWVCCLSSSQHQYMRSQHRRGVVEHDAMMHHAHAAATGVAAIAETARASVLDAGIGDGK